MKKFSLGLFLIVSLTFLAGCERSTVTGEIVDLRSNSTRGQPWSEFSLPLIRDQGRRNTCQTFGAIAALEAAYKREMGLDLDLSEEFTNFFGKNLFLRCL